MISVSKLVKISLAVKEGLALRKAKTFLPNGLIIFGHWNKLKNHGYLRTGG